eukprot:1028135-Rhodomonas_salina.1
MGVSTRRSWLNKTSQHHPLVLVSLFTTSSGSTSSATSTTQYPGTRREVSEREAGLAPTSTTTSTTTSKRSGGPVDCLWASSTPFLELHLQQSSNPPTVEAEESGAAEKLQRNGTRGSYNGKV